MGEVLTLEARVDGVMVNGVRKQGIALMLTNTHMRCPGPSGNTSVAIPGLDGTQSSVAHLHTRPVDAHAINWNSLKDWIQTFETDHPTYNIQNFATLGLPGFRVMDCRTREVVIGPRNSKYAALSYV
jgi:hypothetical protein